MDSIPTALHPLRVARKARGWSQEALGAQLRPPVGKAAVSQWEADLTQPVPPIAIQLVDLFEAQLTLDDLYRRTSVRAAA